jgi:hypothetical protein
MEARNTAIFAAIIETRSLTIIHYEIEEALSKTADVDDRALMQQIQGLNSLDEIYIICHNRISNWHLYCASAIRKFLETKKGRHS